MESFLVYLEDQRFAAAYAPSSSVTGKEVVLSVDLYGADYREVREVRVWSFVIVALPSTLRVIPIFSTTTAGEGGMFALLAVAPSH